MMYKNECGNQCNNHAGGIIIFFSGGEPSGWPSALSASTLRLTPSLGLGDGDTALANRGGVVRNDGASGVLTQTGRQRATPNQGLRMTRCMIYLPGYDRVSGYFKRIKLNVPYHQP